VQDTIAKYFPEFTTIQIEKLYALTAIYGEWNQKINVISRKDISHFGIHHILHSLALIKVIHPTPSILDIGTGGGFPGIPLAIAMPDVHFVLIDSIHKKIRVVDDVVARLQLSNVETHCTRMEVHKGKYGAIVSRAVAPTLQLMEWTKHNTFKDTTYYLLKGGDLLSELHGVRCHEVIAISDYFDEGYFETKKIVKIKV